MMLDQNRNKLFLAKPIHPGEMLQHELEPRSLSQRELASN